MSSKTVETKCAGGVVLNKYGEVLVVNQNGDSWSLPKGHIDPGEDRLTTAKREIYEESGVSTLNLLQDLGSYKRYRIALDGRDDLGELKTIYMFLFSTTQMDLNPIDPHNPEAKWVDISDVSKLLTHPKDKIFFDSAKHNCKL